MAQQDYAGLLTGLDTRPRNPMQGLDREGRMAQRAQGFANRMTGGMLQAAGQDSRTPQQQANAAIGSLKLETDDPVEQQANIEAVRKVDATRAQMLASMYDKRNKERAATAKEDTRADARLKIAEETLKMKKAATERELGQADAVLAQQGVSRALFAQQARDNNNEPLAEAIETGGVSLERAGSILFGSSNALVKPATPEETEAFDRILDTAAFEKKIEKLETGWVFKTLSGATKQAVYFKAKELMARGKLSTEDALTQAIEAVEALNLTTDDDGTGGTGGGSRKNRRAKTGGNVPESKTDDAFGEVK